MKYGPKSSGERLSHRHVIGAKGLRGEPIGEQTIARQKSKAKGFPIVGIGASAGGLEAFTEFLQNLPTDTGMAFVLVQHLDPVHESALTQLLARATPLKVSEVTNRMEVEPNQVYVIPPNVCMEIVGGVLKLKPRKKTGGATRSIDKFFESLAQDQQERAIGIVLSGTATDGTQGLEMIKSEGGITFAQDDSAKYESMPRSAVAAGCVDFTLSPREIARELARIAEHPLVARMPPARNVHTSAQVPGVAPEHSSDEDAYKRILLLLRNYRGVDFSVYKPNTLQRRIARRMVLNKQKRLADYAQFLKGNAKELDPLYSDILINVTNFFRNPEAFEALKQKVFPSLVQQPRQDDPVRVWSLGCSTGQEAYSIAMAYTEFCDNIPRAPQLQLFATDINEPSLERARMGLYSTSQVADLSPERLKRFFVEEKGGFRISKSMRELCVFARHNVLSDPPFSRMDLISCRNLLIYLDIDSHKRILPNLHYALKPGGFLFLGASESIGSFTNLFGAADKKQKIFVKKPSVTHGYRLPVSRSHPSERKGGPVVKREAPGESARVETTAQREADRLLVKRFAPPSVLIDANLQVLQFRGATKAFLEPPTGKATFDLLKMARTGLMVPLRTSINEAKKTNAPVSRKDVRWEEEGHTRRVAIDVIPLNNLKERSFLVLFNESAKTGIDRTAALPEQEKSHSLKRKSSAAESGERRIADLEQELSEARDYAQSLHEQHEAASEEIQASSEELQSANEELQSINEELETSKEELESTNEELTTVNEELASRNTELNRVNSDLNNLQSSAGLPIVLLGRDLSIRHFSPQAEKQFNLATGDVGRPFGKVRHDLELPDLEKLITDAITKVRERECEVRDRQGRWHFLHIRPYITLDNKVDGAVLVLTDVSDLKESQQALTVERDFAESILRTSAEPLLVLDGGLRVERANEAFYSTFKVNPAETVGRTVFELDHGHWNVPRLQELLNDILPRHSFFNNFEVKTKFEHLGERTMLLNARTMPGTSSQPPRILLGIQDITELLHYQAELRHSELRFRRLFEASRDGVLIIDPETSKIIDANPFMSELLGCSHAEIVGKELFEIGLKDEWATRATFEALRHKKCICLEDVTLERKGGQRRELEFVSNLYQEGAVKVIQCQIRDITERKLADRKFRDLLESAPDAMIITSREGKIELVNAQTEKMFGYARGELLGNAIEILIPARFHGAHPGHREAFIADPRARSMGLGMELSGLRKDGTEFPVEISLSPVESDSGVMISAAVRDITKRKKAEEELSLAQSQLANRARHLESAVAARTADLTAINQQLEAFVYSIAHDLRAPLRAMQGFSAILLDQEAPRLSEAGRHHAERINKAAQYMDSLLQDLLAFSRISQQRVELTSVELTRIVETVLGRLEAEIKEKNVTVETLGPWPAVLAHEASLAQVLFNLCSNALKFLRPEVQPLLRLWTEDKGEGVRIWIEDNGIGIEPEHGDEIFRLFTRLHGEKYGGTGLGLAIVRQALERMDGKVGMESTPGQGSRFWIELKKPN